MQADRKAIGLVIGSGILLLLLLGFGLRTWQQYRVAASEAEVLARGKARLDLALGNATAGQVEKILDGLQTDLKLTKAQRERLHAEAQPRIATLPRELDNKGRIELSNFIREELRDGSISAAERERIQDFISKERLDEKSASHFVSEQEQRFQEANDSLQWGRRLVARDPQEAREYFKRAADTDPGNGMAWANLGAAEMVLGREDRARECYRRAIEADPRNWLAHYNLGVAAARGGEPGAALNHLEKAFDFLPPEAGSEREVILDDLEGNPVFTELRRYSRFGGILTDLRSAGAAAR